ncbi:class I adenylate-forming enzyme family protein [Streptomyces sp. NBC_00557]|uniref:class I adenylate-forming enzyme family protein n=1 Tax=Streptomyces sp. NBC_00557 TaxID=2975776 RepID=UPI002E806600|nr:AMP-binding protein [Streptomyces sp. NBC_00557]WUC34239.1 AMP-binding protein [Streptomyces sp. NBC_00557]
MLYQALSDIAARRPGHRAVTTTDGTAVTYAELVELVDRTAAGLHRHGIAAGDTVACSLRNSVGYVALILAVARTGARYVPLMSNFDTADTATALRLTGPRLIVADHDRPFPADSPPRVRLDDLTRTAPAPRPPAERHAGVFRALWTSGSTGFPKQMVWRQDKFLRERRRWLADTGITGDDVFFCRHTLDVAHATDLHMFAALLSGAELVLADPHAAPAVLLRQLQEHRATAMSALPRHYEEYVRAAAGGPAPDLSRLRRPLCGGAYLSPAQMRDAADVLGIHIRQIYGSTEFGLALGNMADVLQAERGMFPVHGVGTRLEPLAPDRPDLGELVLRSDCTSEGYVGSDEANARTFRGDEFWTGDVAERQPDGSLRILGRVTEILAAAGGPLPAPVLDEEIAAQCPVLESVALPARPGAYGNEVLLAVHPDPARPGSEVRKSVEAVLRGHGLSGTVRLTGDIPHTPVGKPDKPALRSRWETETGTEAPHA